MAASSIVAVVLAIIVIVSPWRSAEHAYQQALSVISQDPAQAERLSQTAIDKAGGDYPDAQLVQCRALSALQQWHEALGAFSLIKNPSRCDPSQLLLLGETAVRGQFVPLADRAFDAALDRERPPVRAFKVVADYWKQQRRASDLLILCRRWATLQPDEPEAWSIAADIEASRFQLAASITDFEEALRRQPESQLRKHIQTSLVQLYADTGDFRKARIHLDALRESAPLDPQMKIRSAQVLRMEGRVTEALAQIEEFLAQGDPSAPALKQRGILNLDLGNVAAAIHDLEGALAIDDYDKEAHFKLAQAFLRSKDDSSAQTHLKRHRELTNAALQLVDLTAKLNRSPENAEWQEQLRQCYLKLGREPPPGR